MWCVSCQTELNYNLSLDFLVAGSGLAVTGKLRPLPTVALWDGYGIAVPSNGLVRNTRRATEERCEVSEDTGQKWKSKSQKTTGWWGCGNLKIGIFCSDICSSEWGIVQKRTRNAFFHKRQVLFTLNQNYIKQLEKMLLQWKQIFTPVNISQVEFHFKSVCTYIVYKCII